MPSRPSWNVEFTADVIPGKRPPAPRLETADQIMSMGLSGSLDDALREATSSMADWLMTDYKLTPSETAQVMGVASEYKISEVAERKSGVVLKIRKSLLLQLGD